MNLLLLLAHDIAEYDDLRMFAKLGYDVFSIGGYSNPMEPASNIRPPAPEVPYHPELEALCHAQRVKHEGDPMTVDVGRERGLLVVDWAKADLHPDLIDWADVIICHHYLEPWILSQWPKLRHKRVIWRTCGQSDARLSRKSWRRSTGTAWRSSATPRKEELACSPRSRNPSGPWRQPHGDSARTVDRVAAARRAGRHRRGLDWQLGSGLAAREPGARLDSARRMKSRSTFRCFSLLG